ncbi:hypothetical protein BVI434_250003 [Burkholderia vietnamiensis]|nr:hypothetical protein BVI434_250003 [Burkholderia vietnamiensis]
MSASAMARLEEWLPRAARFGVRRAQNPAYRPALPFECTRAGAPSGAPALFLTSAQRA